MYKRQAVTNFTIAVNDGFGDKQDTDFIECTVWRKVAEAVTNYCRKGTKVTVQGKLKQQAWKDKDGNNRKRIYVDVYKRQGKGATVYDFRMATNCLFGVNVCKFWYTFSKTWTTNGRKS